MPSANQITINFDSVNGQAETYAIYEIDWSTLTGLSGYATTTEKTVTMPDITGDVHYISFVCENSGVMAAMSQIPVIENDSNNLCRYVCQYEQIPDSSTYGIPYIRQPGNSHPEQVGVIPDKWGQSPHYFTLEVIYSNIERKYYERIVPISMHQAWDNRVQYYEDDGGQLVRCIYLKNGYSFAVTKCPIEFSIGTWYPLGMTVYCGNVCEPFRPYTPEDTFQAHYVFTQGADNVSFAQDPNDNGKVIMRQTSYGARFTQEDNGWRVMQLFFHTVINGTDHYGVFLVVIRHSDGVPIAVRGTFLSDNFWSANLGRDPGNWGVPSNVGGGAGTFTPTQQDDRGDAAGVELGTDITARNSSMSTFFTGASGYKLHQINPADMQPIFAQLYSTNYFHNWLQSFYNPLSAVLTLHLIPQLFQSVIGGSQNPQKSELTASGYNISRAISQTDPPEYPELNPIVHKNIGSHNMERFFDAFPDFAPYTKCYLHLPYIGVQEIDVNAIAQGTIAVDYVCDVLNGNLAAYVWCQDREGHCTYKYCASGNCAYSIPLFANSQDGSALGKLISSGVGFTAGLATGNTGAIIGGVMGAADAAGSMLTRSTQVQGQFGSNAGMVMDTECFLEIIRPAWIEPETYRQLRGLPAMMAGTLLDDGTDQHQPYFGYVRAVQIDTDQIDGATDEERSEIETIITNGIYIKQ